MLTTSHLTIGYGTHAVLTDISLTLPEGKLTVLIGANGCGKSTLLRTLTAVQPPLSGDIILGGTPLTSLSASELARRMSLVLTDRTGGGGLRVSELVAIGRHPYSGFFGRLSAADCKAVADAIDLVGLTHKADSFTASLSDGERQKAMIARAIAQSTDIIVLDEPTSFLDVAARFDIISLLSDMTRRLGKTILLSTHDIAPAIAAADNLWTITKNTLHAGTCRDIVSSGILDHVFPNAAFNNEKGDFVPWSK